MFKMLYIFPMREIYFSRSLKSYDFFTIYKCNNNKAVTQINKAYEFRHFQNGSFKIR